MNSSGNLNFTMVASVAYLLSPLFYGVWLLHELEAGAFPENADSIGIPLAGFMILWFAGLIIAGVVAITLVYKKVFLDKD